MPQTFVAVYENGLLRPLEPLRLAERQQRVSLTIDGTPVPDGDDDLIDYELLHSLETEHLSEVTLEQVRAVMAKIPGSMTADFIAEREERF
jgi:predicted DNA-binding antitoxin AbrB/MazE fold protein